MVQRLHCGGISAFGRGQHLAAASRPLKSCCRFQQLKNYEKKPIFFRMDLMDSGRHGHDGQVSVKQNRIVATTIQAMNSTTT